MRAPRRRSRPLEAHAVYLEPRRVDAAQAVVVYYSWRNGVALIASWNALFVLINLSMVVVILRERRGGEIPSGLRDLHQQHFAALAPAEFMRWWQMGEDDMVHDRMLLLAGTHPQWLYFVLSGTVRIERLGAAAVDVPAGHPVGEMSLLTGQPANADVKAVGCVVLRRWATTELQHLRQRKPAVWTQIQSAIGFDLVQKSTAARRPRSRLRRPPADVARGAS